ncbi:alpha/beta hydrolase [Nocardia sp. NPDC050712]|uniref:alpha/beta fold hydrolase n=1 Tax=Nocardia sp. NPDC050712 TaxID=3155518 RepID=UPI0033E7A789
MPRERRAVYAGYRTRELYVQGAGPTLVLVHGFGTPAPCWQPVLARCEQAGQPAVAVDLPGFGAADPLAAGPRLPQLVRFLADVVARHGAATPVVLVGNSLGAATCVRLLDTVPGLPVGGLLALGTATDQWTPLVRAALIGRGRPLAALAALPLPLPRAVRDRVAVRLVGRVLYGRSPADPALVGLLLAELGSIERRELVSIGIGYVSDVAAVAAVRTIGCPTIVVHGTRDRLVAGQGSRNLAAAVPGSRLVVLEGVGHCPHLDATDEVVALARELARAISATGTETA